MNLKSFKANKVIIVGSSEEAKNFVPIPGFAVIAVNGAIYITKEHTDMWFTLDPSPANIEIMETKPYKCHYVAAVPDDFGRANAKGINHRKRIEGVHYLKRVADRKNYLSCKYGLSEDGRAVHTGNSGYGALNLAYLMGAKTIVLLGITGDGRLPRYDGSYSRNLNHLPSLFASAKPQLDRAGVQVYDTTMQSKLKCFDKMRFHQLWEQEII